MTTPESESTALLLNLPPEMLSLICTALPCIPEMRLLMSTKRLAARAEETKETRRRAVLGAFESLISRVRDQVSGAMRTLVEHNRALGKFKIVRFNTTNPRVIIRIILTIENGGDLLHVAIDAIGNITHRPKPIVIKTAKKLVVYPHKGTLGTKGRSTVESPMHTDLSTMLENEQRDLFKWACMVAQTKAG
jgi:hypothetical protein